VTRLARTAFAVVLLGALSACQSGSSTPPTRSSPPTPAATSTASRSQAPRPRAPSVSARVLRLKLPTPTSRAVVIAEGSSLIVAGGETATSSTTAILLVDPVTGRIRTIGALVAPGHDAAGVRLPVGDLVFGGGISASVTTVQRISTSVAFARATVVGQLPRPRSDLVVARVGGLAYVLGGYDGSLLQTDVLSTPDGAHFRRVASLRVPVRYPAVAVLGRTIYLFGGERGTTPTSAVQAIDTATGKVHVVARLPHAMGHATALVLDGTIVIAGGRTSGGPQRAIWVFDPTRRAFTAVGVLPAPLSDAAGAVIGHVGYLVGGEDRAPVASIIELRAS
jgi:Kelch motif